MLGQSLRHCIANLARFSGRDRPGQFWPWAGLVLGVTFVVWIAAFVTSFIGVFGRIQQFAKDHPDQVTVEQGPGYYSIQVHGSHPELMLDFGNLNLLLGGVVAMIAVLLGAAVVRRLHDSDRHGWIALIPLALLVSGWAILGSLTEGLGPTGVPEISMILLLFAINLAYLATLGVLVYFLIRKGTPGPNRFGEPPA